MAHVVTDVFKKCNYMEGVAVYPVDCFYEGENMLVINPDECIDCGVSELECPAKANPSTPNSEGQQWLDLNTLFSSFWPHVIEKNGRTRLAPTPTRVNPANTRYTFWPKSEPEASCAMSEVDVLDASSAEQIGKRFYVRSA
jgi:ferredoxin